MGLFLHGVRFFIFSPVFPTENGSFNISLFKNMLRKESPFSSWAIVLPLSAAEKYRVISAGQRRHVRSSPICKMDATDEIGPYIRTVKNPPASRQAMPEDPRSMLQSRSAEKKEIRDSLFVFSDNGKKPAMAGHDFPFFFIRLKSRFCHAPRISASIGRDFSAHLPAHPCQVRPSRQPDRDFGKSRKLTQDSTCPGKGFHFLRRKTAHL